ncbi:MAG: hypothetical protein P0S96_07020 [Simkaniaceae bacterium]|nr:hypothetical protein [Candidatus Sacchlamyda saccharinae]
MDASLKLGEFPTTVVSTCEFFEHLSRKDGIVYGYGYDNTLFKVSRNQVVLNGQKWKVEETAVGWKYNPLRRFLSPFSGTDKKSTTANLVGLIKDEKVNIVKLPGVNINRVTAAFARIRDKMVRNANSNDAAVITKNIDEAIDLLRQEAIKYDIDTHGVKPKPGDDVPVGQFFKDLSGTWQPFRFNKRFHVVESNRAAQFTVHYESKPWFFQKAFRWPKEITSLRFWRDMRPSPVSGPAKVATAERLAKMIVHERAFLRTMRPNTDAMIANLERIKGRIVKHTNPQERARIEAGFDKAIAEVRKVGFLARKDKNKTWTTWIWNWTAVPMGNLAYKTGSLAVQAALAGMKAPFKLAWSVFK